MLCILCTNGYFTEVNLRFAEVLGYTNDELVSKSFFDFLHPDDINKNREQFNKFLVEKRPEFSYINRFRKKSGKYIHLEWTAAAPSNGAIYASARDVSQHIDRDKLLDKIQDIAKIGHWSVLMKDTPEVSWSRGTYAILGVPLQETITVEKGISFYVGESKERVTRDFERSVSDGTPFDAKYLTRSRDGKNKWVRSIGIPKLNKHEQVEELHGIFQDITQQYEMEEAIQTAQNRLMVAIEASGMGVWELDLSDYSLFWDAQMYKLFNVAEKDFGGAYDAWRQLVHPDDLESIESEMQSAIDNKTQLDSGFRILCPDSTVRFLKARASIICDSEGTPMKAVGVNWDVTEAEEASEKLKSAKKDADKANQAKSDFLAHMSHEIRTPMNGMLGFLSLLSETKLDSEQEQYIKLISETGSSLRSLINDILDYSKIEAKHMNLTLQDVDINQLVNSVSKAIFCIDSPKGNPT